MIVTVHDLKEFEDRVEFSKDVFFTWETRNEGRHLPKIAVDQKLYGVGRDGVSLVVYNRVTMVTVDNAGDAPNLYDGIQRAVQKVVMNFESETTRFAAGHGCKAVAGDLKPSPLNAHLSSMLAQRLEAIEERVVNLERCAAHQCAEIRTLEKTISPIIEGS